MSAPEPPAPLVLGRAVLDLERRELLVDRVPRHLRAKSFDVLAYLARNPDRVVAKQELIEQVWQGVAVTDDSLVQCLIEVRRALGPEEARIRTIRGKGYRFDASAGAGGPEQNGPPRPARRPAGPLPVPRAGLAPRAVRSLFAAGLLAVGAVAWWAVRTPADSPPPSASGPAAVRPTGPPAAADAPVTPQVTLKAGVAQLMVTGNAAAAKRSQATLVEARRAFEQAIAQDERYAPGHAALANTLVLLSVFGMEPPNAVLPRAIAHGDRAVELDPTFALGWHALAHAEVQWMRDWPRAEMHYRRAIALDPKAEDPAFLLAHLLVALERTDEALQQSASALRVNPRSPILLASAGIVHYLARRSAEALTYFDRALAVDPAYSVASFWQALTLVSLGRVDEAMESALRSRDPMANAPTWVVGFVHARAGRQREAEDVLEVLTAQAATRYVSPMEFTYLTLALGQRERALDWLDTSVREHSRWAEFIAVDPILDPLRDEPRFRAALAAMKLSPRR